MPATTETTTAEEVVINDKFLRVRFVAEYADFHWFWLRHNCKCVGLCTHEKTGEKILNGAKVLLSVKPISVELLEPEKNIIKIVWGQSLVDEPETAQHTSVYSVEFLRENAYALNRVEVPPPPGDLTLIEIDYTKYTYEDYLKECGRRIKEFGAIVIRNRGLDTEEIIKDFLPQGAEVIPTHFGRIEDLRTDNTTNANTDQLGYTNAGVDLHTDQCFIENPPGMQALHCITPADIGGDNYIVDACHAARYLRQQNPVAFERLCRTNVRFHRKQKNFEKLTIRPILQLNQTTGEVDMVRYSYFTYGPHIVPFEFMEEFYKSYAEFDAIVQDPKHQFRFLLNTGDFILYNNHRMFHARTGFSGPRHVRGVYFHVHDVFNKLNISN